MNKAAVKARIEAAIQRYAAAASKKAYALVPQSLTSGKLYEAHVLSLILERLAQQEGFTITLVNSSFIPLKSSHGPVNRAYPYFRLHRGTSFVAELWTDVEFTALSHHLSGGSTTPLRGDFHELDIVVTNPGVNGRPLHSEIWLAVECKNTGYTKGLLKEILGIRRELSLLRGEPQSTRFRVWPRDHVPADPPSCLLVYSTDPAVLEYASPGKTFGIDFHHEEI